MQLSLVVLTSTKQLFVFKCCHPLWLRTWHETPSSSHQKLPWCMQPLVCPALCAGFFWIVKDTTVRWIAHSSGTALQLIRRQRDDWEMSRKYSLPSKKKKKKASLHNSRGKYAGTHLILEIVCCFSFHNEHKPLGKCGLCSHWKARRACVLGGFYPRECCPVQWGCSREVQASLTGCFVSTLYFVGKYKKERCKG